MGGRLFVVSGERNLRHVAIGKKDCQKGRDFSPEQDGDEQMVGHLETLADIALGAF